MPASPRVAPTSAPGAATEGRPANGHGGNITAVEAAVGRLRYECRACFAWHASLPDGDAHAGRSETSVMLAARGESHMTGREGPGTEQSV